MSSDKISYPKNKIKILLLEKVHQSAVAKLTDEGFQVDEIPRALGEEELCENLTDVRVLGIRSKTKVTPKVIESADKLCAIGCFGVGTNQVALDVARARGIPVFNAPFSSTRSVAELTLCQMLMLARQTGDKNNSLHSGRWHKSTEGMHEVRGMVLGLIGYGHIGQQVGLLAEAIGLQVIFYDRMKKLPLGNARPVEDLDLLLKEAGFRKLTRSFCTEGGDNRWRTRALSDEAGELCA